MKKFYIHKDDNQQGPFSLEELKELKITRETPIWYEGADAWKNASEIEELTDLFKSVPPPLVTNIKQSPQIPAVGETIKKKKNKQLAIIASVVFVVGLISFYYFYQQQQANYNMQLELQQRMLEEQQAQIKEQENKEAARLAEEQRQKREAELAALNNEYDLAITNLRKAKIKLDDIQQFHLLRTSSEKQQQIEEQLEVIRSWEKEVDRLKTEIDAY